MESLKIIRSVGIFGLGHTLAQSTFPPSPSGLEHVLSQRWPGASIDYKQTSICEVTPGVKAWSGYVSLPTSVQNHVEHTHASFDVNLFFWYFESRHDAANAPTAIYFGGGPGYTSLDSMSGFPCNINSDSNSTTLNPFSWNNNVNMLYIDQPVGTSFSYATIQNGTLNVANPGPPIFTPLQNNSSQFNTNATFMAATFGSSTTRNHTKHNRAGCPDHLAICPSVVPGVGLFLTR
ncbi:Alpha/Beta hydrolase protein [Trichoderma evansii]